MDNTRTGVAPAVATVQGYVDWSAVTAGAVAALAVSFVLLTFGAAVGLSAVSPWTSSSSTIAAVGIGSAFWILLVALWSFALGGYMAARLRHRWSDATPLERDFRDNAHGLLSWALAVTLAAVVAAFATAGARNGGQVGDNAATMTAVDTITRTARTNVPAADTGMRGLVARALVSNIGNDRLASPDQTFLNEVVAARTGLPAAEAEQRVNTAFAQMKRDADRARKAGIVMAFMAAATLLLGAATAWWAASVGGRHREEGTLWEVFTRRPTSTVHRVI